MLKIKNLSKSYNTNRTILNNLTVSFETGHITLLYGRSGSGKTTLLKCLSGILIPDSGTIELGNCTINSLTDKQRCDFRLSNIGIIYQFFNLLPSLSIKENILLPARVNESVDIDYYNSLIEYFKINKVINTPVKSLSGGESQRVAICRALINKPKIVLADEPTGNLDIENRDNVMTFFKSSPYMKDTTIIIATHDEELKRFSDQLLELKNGTIISS